MKKHKIHRNKIERNKLNDKANTAGLFSLILQELCNHNFEKQDQCKLLWELHPPFQMTNAFNK